MNLQNKGTAKVQGKTSIQPGKTIAREFNDDKDENLVTQSVSCFLGR